VLPLLLLVLTGSSFSIEANIHAPSGCKMAGKAHGYCVV
jgi:hypothetical protein